ncbi:hypothetical protein D9M70_616460 [compost metagenome]
MDALDRVRHLLLVHLGAARAVHAQLLRAFADTAVGLVQRLFLLARLEEARDAARMRQALHGDAHEQRRQQQAEQRRRKPRQVAQAAEGDGQRDHGRGQHEGHVADHVDVLRETGIRRCMR